MAKRVTWRIPIRLNVKVRSEGRECTATVTNLSEYGMFISTDDSGLCEHSQCDIAIPVKEGTLHVPGKLVRRIKVDGGCEGIGIEIIDPPKKYLDYVENLLYVL
ncbi:MAG: PilZ domain-containing protein [Deltaproteobacteria bacterium]|nr:PilZ domain-containing protein [Deltaproteobacteria bacterium]